MRVQIFAFIFLSFVNFSIAEELSISGFYQGKNLYVQNPLSADKKLFCTNEVFVNEKMVLSQIKNSAYTINLSHLENGSPVTIKITYKNDCAPKIINAFVLQKSNQNYTFQSVQIKDNLILWSLKEEVISGRFIIEKYTENYWKPIGTTPISFEKKEYTQNIERYLSEGINKFRVKYLSPDEQVFVSSNISHEFLGESVTFSLTSSNKILLSKESPYEIMDAEGNLIKDGKGNEIAISTLHPGIYYINYANKSEKFRKE